ncbi:unnamed protein product, partial [Amoebophrya sp. A25]|eukprot:GSA25T00020267001.1
MANFWAQPLTFVATATSTASEPTGTASESPASTTCSGPTSSSPATSSHHPSPATSSHHSSTAASSGRAPSPCSAPQLEVGECGTSSHLHIQDERTSCFGHRRSPGTASSKVSLSSEATPCGGGIPPSSDGSAGLIKESGGLFYRRKGGTGTRKSEDVRRPTSADVVLPQNGNGGVTSDQQETNQESPENASSTTEAQQPRGIIGRVWRGLSENRLLVLFVIVTHTLFPPRRRPSDVAGRRLHDHEVGCSATDCVATTSRDHSRSTSSRPFFLPSAFWNLDGAEPSEILAGSFRAFLNPEAAAGESEADDRHRKYILASASGGSVSHVDNHTA